MVSETNKQPEPSSVDPARETPDGGAGDDAAEDVSEGGENAEETTP